MLAASKFIKTWPSIVPSEPLVSCPWQRGWAKRYTALPEMQNFRIKRRAFCLFPPDGGLLVVICGRPEIDNDVMSGLAVDNVGVDVHIKFGDSRSNRFRDIRGADFVSNERTNEQDEAYPNKVITTVVIRPLDDPI